MNFSRNITSSTAPRLCWRLAIMSLLLISMTIQTVATPSQLMAASSSSGTTSIRTFLAYKVNVEFVAGMPSVHWHLILVDEYAPGMYSASIEVTEDISASCLINDPANFTIAGDQAIVTGGNAEMICQVPGFAGHVAAYNDSGKGDYNPSCSYAPSLPASIWVAGQATLSGEIGRHPLLSIPGLLSFDVDQMQAGHAETALDLSDEPSEQRSAGFASSGIPNIFFSGYDPAMVEQILDYSGDDAFMNVPHWRTSAPAFPSPHFLGWEESAPPLPGRLPMASYSTDYLAPFALYIGSNPATGSHANLTIHKLAIDPPCFAG